MTSARRPIAAGVAPASTKSPKTAERGEHEQHDAGQVGAVVDADGADDEQRPAAEPVQDDRRPAEVLELVAPVDEAGEEQQPADGEPDADLERLEAAHEQLVGELGSGSSRTSWKIVWVVNRPRTALIATHVGAISQTWLWPRIRR